MTRVLVTGGRNLTDYELVEGAIVDAHTTYGPLIVVHGACYPPVGPDGQRPRRSADWLAHLVCERLGWRDEPHPANWTGFGKRAGPVRNQYMVDLGARLCLRFPGNNGTEDCARRAALAGIPVVEVTP